MSTANDQNEPLFRERQMFRQPWLRLPIIILSAFMIALGIFIVYEQIFLDIPVGNRPLSDGGVVLILVLLLVLGIGLPWLLFSIALTVTVDRVSLRISFRPFARRAIPVRSIIYCEPRTIEPVREYGGIGIRFSFRGQGIGYIVSGYEGVQIELEDGARLFVGSQFPEELARAIATARSL